MSFIEIGGVKVGPDHQPFVIAEMSGNHNGDLPRALDIVRAVAESGAMTLDLDLPAFRLPVEHELWSEARLYDLYEEAHTPWAWHEPIFELARSLGLVAFSSAFDQTAIDFLEKLNVPAYKVASNEIGDLPLVRGMAETGKPIIISTGSATLTDIDAAVRAARSTGNEQIIVLSCTASYPAPPEQSNLRGIPVLRDALGVQPVGPHDGHRRGGGCRGARRDGDREARDAEAGRRWCRLRVLARTVGVGAPRREHPRRPTLAGQTGHRPQTGRRKRPPFPPLPLCHP
jgi:sialic acid synthase SpsE